MRTFTPKPKSTQQTTSVRSMRSGRTSFGKSHEVKSTLHSQQTIGNQSVQRLLQANAKEFDAASDTTASVGFSHNFSQIPLHPKASAGIQPKLVVSTPSDPYEREADRIAEQVMRMPEPQLQRTCACGGKCPRCRTKQPDQDHESLQTKVVQRTATGMEQPFWIQRLYENQFVQRQPIADEKDMLQLREQSGRTPQLKSADIESRINNLRGGGRPLGAATRSFFESRFGKDFSNVRVHNDAGAANIANAVHARAFTVDNTIVFGSGQYRPESSEGRRLLGHELVHTLQQNNGGTLRRQQATPVTMPPITIRVGMPSDLSSLSTPVPTGSATISHNAAALQLNSQLSGTLLPFTSGGWNGADIANKLGQYDRIPGTDSDAVRCVQAVALMSHILNGPDATIGYLTSISLQGMLSAGRYDTRVRTALRVIDFVKDQIRNRRATYGNMYWAMEAVHDLFYGDASGTPANTPGPARDQIVPMLDLAQNMVNMDVWCNTPAVLMSQAATLNPGEQFMLNTWTVSFNYYFDMAGASATQQNLTYTRTDEHDRPLSTVSIHRLDTTRGKPAHTQIDTNRDHKSGHQMLIYKDAADMHIKMYEPEVTTSGRHLFDLTSNRSVLSSLIFNDQPAFELFNYVQLLGKIVPTPAASLFVP